MSGEAVVWQFDGNIGVNAELFEIDGTVITGDTTQPLPSATLTVFEEAGPPGLPGQDNPPKDLDDDGRYEDVNGDGEFSIADVQVLFENRDSTAVTNNTEAFNFDENDPPGVSLSDVQALYTALTQSG